MNFYERFTILCEKNNVKPNTVAQNLGLSNSAATYWKRGSSPKGETLQKIADYFGVTVGYLLGTESMSTQETKASLSLEGYIKSLGFEFIDHFEDWGEKYELCIDHNGKKLYKVSRNRISALENSINQFAKFSLSELLSSSEEVEDTLGFLSQK